MPGRYFRVLGKPWHFDLGVRPNDVNYTSDTLNRQVLLSKLTSVLGYDSLDTKHQLPSVASPPLYWHQYRDDYLKATHQESCGMWHAHLHTIYVWCKSFSYLCDGHLFCNLHVVDIKNILLKWYAVTFTSNWLDYNANTYHIYAHFLRMGSSVEHIHHQ